MNAKKAIALTALFGVTSLSGVGLMKTDACSRVVYKGEDNLVIVGRSLDWKTPIPTNLYVYPRGMAKVSTNLPASFGWTSLYGSVLAVGYDGGVTEGMNEKGLVINGLFCKGTIYNKPDAAKDGKPEMSLAVFVSWLLDLNATTQEAVDALRNRNFNISGQTFDGGTVSTLHWAITDASGETAVFEFVNGELKIYDKDNCNSDMLVLTNDPTYNKMLAINDYWKGIGGANMLPGTVKSPDRFVRADYFVHHVKPTADPDLGMSITRSILMNVSVPYTYTIESEPNVSSTQWRSFADAKNKRYYFDIVTNYGVYYIDLEHLDLYKGAPVLKLDTSLHKQFAGCINKELKVSAPFKPMY